MAGALSSIVTLGVSPLHGAMLGEGEASVEEQIFEAKSATIVTESVGPAQKLLLIIFDFTHV